MKRAFTVVELLVAVVVLLAVIIATSKIFNMAAKVSSTGEAVADVMQQATVLQEQMRRDLERLSRDGYFAIQCVAVRNDVRRFLDGSNGASAAPLLIPDPPISLSAAEIASLGGGNPVAALEEARRRYIVRCDQLVFFTAGTEQSAKWAGPGDLAVAGGGQRAKATRIYYGHGVQFPGLANDPVNSGADGTSPVKPIIGGMDGSLLGGAVAQITPWTYSPPSQGNFVRLLFDSGPISGAPRIPATQPESRQWVLARRAVLLADDGGSPWYYPELVPPDTAPAAGSPLPDISSAPSVFGDRVSSAINRYPMELPSRDWIGRSTNLIPSQMIQSGWVDIAASDMDAIRRTIAPTLPLNAPYVVWRSSASGAGPNDEWRVSSVVPPWTAPAAGESPLGWPTGSVFSFPSGELLGPAQTVSNFGDLLLGQPGTVAIYSTQRDRILRGSFGMSATGGLPGPSGQIRVGLLGWPRAERSVPNLSRRTELLAAPVIVSNCSSFRIDWTWEPLVGRSVDALGNVLSVADRAVITNSGSGVTVRGGSVASMRGFEPWAIDAAGPQPWFGYPDAGSGPCIPIEAQRYGVRLAQEFLQSVQVAAVPLHERPNVHMGLVAKSIEGSDPPAPGQHPAILAPFGTNVPVRVYSAVFGFNSDEAALIRSSDQFSGLLSRYDANNDQVLSVGPGSELAPVQGSQFWDLDGDSRVTRGEYDGFHATRVIRDDYTPWPSQVRVTAVIHDPRLNLERGREIQFVLDVPNRGTK
jgi:competence protein ComGC